MKFRQRVCIDTCRQSEYYTEDIKSADAVFVYDYCYIQWMIGDMHANERKFPHREVHQKYTALSRLDRSVKAHNVVLDSQMCAQIWACARTWVQQGCGSTGLGSFRGGTLSSLRHTPSAASTASFAMSLRGMSQPILLTTTWQNRVPSNMQYKDFGMENPCCRIGIMDRHMQVIASCGGGATAVHLPSTGRPAGLLGGTIQQPRGASSSPQGHLLHVKHVRSACCLGSC